MERARQIKAYAVAGEAVLKALQEQGIIKGKIINYEQELYTYYPKDELEAPEQVINEDPSRPISVIANHTVVTGAMAKYAQEFFRELLAKYKDSPVSA